MKIQTIVASAFVLAMALMPTVSAQSGPPEQPSIHDNEGFCDTLRNHMVDIQECEWALWYVDMHVWAVNFALFCFQYPSQCSTGIEVRR